MLTKPRGSNRSTMRTPFTSQELKACRKRWRDFVSNRLFNYTNCPCAAPKLSNLFLFMQLQVNRVCLTQLSNSQGTESLLTFGL